MPRIPKLSTKDLAVKIGIARRVPLHEMEDHLDAADNERRTVCCVVCGRTQLDEGMHHACSYCGTSPLASYAYPPDSPFYPQKRGESQQQRIERLVAERRAAAGR